MGPTLFPPCKPKIFMCTSLSPGSLILSAWRSLGLLVSQSLDKKPPPRPKDQQPVSSTMGPNGPPRKSTRSSANPNGSCPNPQSNVAKSPLWRGRNRPLGHPIKLYGHRDCSIPIAQLCVDAPNRFPPVALPFRRHGFHVPRTTFCQGNAHRISFSFTATGPERQPRPRRDRHDSPTSLAYATTRAEADAYTAGEPRRDVARLSPPDETTANRTKPAHRRNQRHLKTTTSRRPPAPRQKGPSAIRRIDASTLAPGPLCTTFATPVESGRITPRRHTSSGSQTGRRHPPIPAAGSSPLDRLVVPPAPPPRGCSPPATTSGADISSKPAIRAADGFLPRPCRQRPASASLSGRKDAMARSTSRDTPSPHPCPR